MKLPLRVKKSLKVIKSSCLTKNPSEKLVSQYKLSDGKDKLKIKFKRPGSTLGQTQSFKTHWKSTSKSQLRDKPISKIVKKSFIKIPDEKEKMVKQISDYYKKQVKEN